MGDYTEEIIPEYGDDDKCPESEKLLHSGGDKESETLQEKMERLEKSGRMDFIRRVLGLGHWVSKRRKS